MQKAKKGRSRSLIIGFAVVLLLSVSTAHTYAATAMEDSKPAMETMTTSATNSHDMTAMDPTGQNNHTMKAVDSEAQSGHDMNNMKEEKHSSAVPENDNPWPILYGFGGAILLVILVAGTLKYSKLKKQGV